MQQIQHIETIYVGGLLNQPREIPAALEQLSTYKWTNAQCKIAFELIVSMNREGIELDPSVLLHGSDEKLDASFIADMMTTAPKTQNMEFYRDQLLRAEQRSISFDAADSMRSKADAGDIEFSKEIATITAASMPKRKTLFSYSETFDETIETMEEDLQRDEMPGFNTGWHGFDEITCGLHPKDLVIVAARPSMGKTAFAINIVNRAINEGKRCIFFSLEMSRDKIMRRFISLNAKVNGLKLQSLDFADDELDRIVAMRSRWSGDNFYISDLNGNVEQIQAQVLQAVAKMGSVDFILVDYLQLIKSGARHANREREIAFISNALKQLAKDHDCTVIAVSQLSRAVDSRPDKRPVMSDLRDSGAIEQDADQIVLLYREDYYNPNCNNPGQTNVNVAKNRNGSIGDLNLTFQPGFMQFSEN